MLFARDDTKPLLLTGWREEICGDLLRKVLMGPSPFSSVSTKLINAADF